MLVLEKWIKIPSFHLLAHFNPQELDQNTPTYERAAGFDTNQHALKLCSTNFYKLFSSFDVLIHRQLQQV